MSVPLLSISTISNNTASFGGGIYNDYSSSVNLNGGSIDHNTAYYVGGGIYSKGNLYGDWSLAHDNNPDDIYVSVSAEDT
jgi:hypothetical protein